jgi:ketosteroid isomerase-like protein
MDSALTGSPGLPAEVVRRQYLAAATGDLDTPRETLAADVEWTEMAGFPLGGTYRGPDAVVTGVLARLAAEWDGFAAHDDRYITDGEDVVVLARYTGRHSGTGKELNVRVAHHYTVRGGKIVRFEQFVDSALVRQAMK